MNIIPNVYQAAYMEGLANKKNSNKGSGIFDINNLSEGKTKRLVRQAFDLGLSSARPYTVEITPKGQMFKGTIFAAQNQSEVAKVLNKMEIGQFPIGSVKTKTGTNTNPLTMTERNVSSFLDGILTNSFEHKTNRKSYDVTVNFRRVGKDTVRISKGELFGLSENN